MVGVLSHLGIKFKGVNVLEDDAIREGIKTFTNWPTIPQLYIRVNLSAVATLSVRCMKPVN